MKNILTTCKVLLLIPCFFYAQIGSGHHSFPAQYDADKPITLTGYLIKMEWRNPHVYFYLEVEDGNDIEEWAFEMGSPISMGRLGWNRNSVQVGEILEVEGSLARDGSNLVNASTVLLSESGRRMFAGSSREEEQGQ
ncbi:MAG: DUF6152 family protein [Gammaproteobacteria bacterium]|nr:DUF6152 family protein [Gammaproteobacteria bacterium]